MPLTRASCGSAIPITLPNCTSVPILICVVHAIHTMRTALYSRWSAAEHEPRDSRSSSHDHTQRFAAPFMPPLREFEGIGADMPDRPRVCRASRVCPDGPTCAPPSLVNDVDIPGIPTTCPILSEAYRPYVRDVQQAGYVGGVRPSQSGQTLYWRLPHGAF